MLTCEDKLRNGMSMVTFFAKGVKESLRAHKKLSGGDVST